MTQRPKRGTLMFTKEVEEVAKNLKSNGCVVNRDKAAGTIEAKDGDLFVFRAIQKGRCQPWIGMFFDTDRIKWTLAENEVSNHGSGA